MFDFMYAKKIDKDIVMEIIDKYKDEYRLIITHKSNGDVEIFVGSKREKDEG